jgi:dienelactone hydrolase
MSGPIRIPIGEHWLHGDSVLPPEPAGLVLLAHGSGSSRQSSRYQLVARALEQHALATLLVDLLTEDEGAIDRRTAQFRFDIGMLGDRLVAMVDTLKRRHLTASLPIGLFGVSTGGGAALVAAASRPRDIVAVVSRGGCPDLARGALSRVVAPTLLIVGELDREVLQLNREAAARMRGEVALEVVPGATHLFEEPGTLEQVTAAASQWFARHFAAVAGAGHAEDTPGTVVPSATGRR